jgi:hypothetical protein
LFSEIAELVIASSRWARIEGVEGIEGTDLFTLQKHSFTAIGML